HKKHVKPNVGFIGAIEAHSICILHAGHFRQFKALYIFEERPNQSFKNMEDIFLLYECHFTVDLCKLRLPVCSEILIPKTFYDLEIPVKTGNHEQLLKRLRRLREG